MANVNRLIAIRDLILKHHELFDMSTWDSNLFPAYYYDLPEQCNTTKCIAGHVWAMFEPETYPDKGVSGDKFLNKGSELLDLSMSEAMDLFYSNNDDVEDNLNYLIAKYS